MYTKSSTVVDGDNTSDHCAVSLTVDVSAYALGSSRRVMLLVMCEKNCFEIILKLFRCFISHVTTSETEIKLFQLLTSFPNYLSNIEHVGKYP